MENLHLKNLDMNKILKKIKPNDNYIDEDDNDFEYDDDDDEWEWTEEDEKEFRKHRRHEHLIIILLIATPSILFYIMLVAAIYLAR